MIPTLPHRISVITRSEDPELLRISESLDEVIPVGGRNDLEQYLCTLLNQPAIGTRTLDLIGHSTGDTSLLQLGDWVVDGANRVVRAFFRELDEQEVFGRLGIVAIRLLGCGTASTKTGKATLRQLAQIANVEVYGSSSMIYSAHYDAGGFRDDCEHLLVPASEAGAQALPTTVPSRRRVLDIDLLPARPLVVYSRIWPRYVATREAGQAMLRLVRRNDGAHMPGLLTSPTFEVALPARDRLFHQIQVLQNGEFVRVYFDDSAEGVVFPVTDPVMLRSLAVQLPEG